MGKIKIEIELDEQELREQITGVIAKKLFEDYCMERRDLKKIVEKCVKDAILPEKDTIVAQAIDRAAAKIAYGAAPKLVEKLAGGGK